MAPLSEPQPVDIKKEAADFTGLTVEAASSSPRASSEPEEIQDPPSPKQPASAPPSSGTEDSEFQPKAPARSVTVNDQHAFARLAEQIFRSGGTEQPFIVNFGKIERIEIVNGSVAHCHPSSPKSASDVDTIETNPDKPGQKIKRSRSQMSQTTRVALKFWERLLRMPRPKPFTMWCLVKDADNRWQDLEVKLDTGGGAGNLIPYSKVKALGLLERIRPSSVTVVALGNNPLKTEGELDIDGKWNGSQEGSVTFQVVHKDNEDVNETMFGAEAISTFNLLRIRFAGTTPKGNGHSINPPIKKGNEKFSHRNIDFQLLIDSRDERGTRK